MSDDRDYVTINPAVAHARFNVVVMKYHSGPDEYSVFRCSEPLPRLAAEALAKSWAAAMQCEVR